MHVEHNHRVDTLSDLAIEVRAHQIDKGVEVFSLFLELVLHSVLVSLLAFTEHVFDTECPPDLRTNQGDHTDLFHDPLNAVHFSVEKYRFLAENVQSLFHLFVNSSHPVFNVAFWFYGVFELVNFAFIGGHVGYGLVSGSESKLFTVIVELEQVGLDCLGVAGTQDLKEIVIWNEVEARQHLTFVFEVSR